MDKQIRDLQDLINIQSEDGNWNYDPYMFGMLNGLICALSILTGKDPEYRTAPKIWKTDIDKLAEFNKKGIVIENR